MLVSWMIRKEGSFMWELKKVRWGFRVVLRTKLLL